MRCECARSLPRDQSLAFMFTKMRTDAALPHLGTLFPASTRRRPMVTVIDGASHTLGFLGAAFGAPVVPLGMDRFGQSGTISDLYAYAGIDTDHIVEAALVALEL